MVNENQQIGTVGKALDVLETVAAWGRPVRFAELLPKSPYPKATLYRFLQTLRNQGMLSYDSDQGTYFLGLRLLRLAHAAWATSSLASIAQPYLDSLAKEADGSIYLAQLDQGQVLYVDRRNGAKQVEMFSSAGTVVPAYCTGVGKAMLAYLDEGNLRIALTQQSFLSYTPSTLVSPNNLRAELRQIRDRGHALECEEHELGIISCAVPIRVCSGRVIGALSIASTTARTTLGALEARSDRLKAIAGLIAATAVNWRFPEHKTG